MSIAVRAQATRLMDIGHQFEGDRDSFETAIMLLSAAAVGTYMASRFSGIDAAAARRRGAVALKLGVYRNRTLDLSRYGMRVWWDMSPLENHQFEIDVDTIAVGGPRAYERMIREASGPVDEAVAALLRREPESQMESQPKRFGAAGGGASR